MENDMKKGGSIFRSKHYANWKIEPMTFCIINNVPLAEGNIICYIMRWCNKNEIEDLKKAKRVIDMIIESEKNKNKYIPEKGCL